MQAISPSKLAALSYAAVILSPVLARESQGAPGQVPSLPPGAKVYRDLAYVTSGHARQKLDLYVPARRALSPVIVYIHGGAWQAGSKESKLAPTQYLQRGYAVASLDYRLSGDAIFPAQIEDCKAAVRWLRAHATQYRLDTGRFASWGESAGGHLAALLGTAGSTTTFDVGENLRHSSKVKAVVDYYGPTDFLQMDAHALPGAMQHNPATSPESKLIGGAIQQNAAKVQKANPITYVNRASPPFFIAHGTMDTVVPYHQSQLLEAALKNAGVAVTLLPVTGAGHNFSNATAAQTAEIERKTQAFLAKYLNVP